MLIRDWMTRDVITVAPETSMMQASKLMKEKNIRRLPVVDAKGLLVGIVSDRDVKAASPSKATTLDVHELYYLLDELRIKDIMTRSPLTVKVTDTVERAAILMDERDIGGLPVVDDAGKVVGIITDSDVFRVLISITGARHGGVQLGLRLPNQDGALQAVVDDLRGAGARVLSILTSIESVEAGERQVYIRILPLDRAREDALVEMIKSRHALLYWARDQVHHQE